jgi:hypothetical protein
MNQSKSASSPRPSRLVPVLGGVAIVFGLLTLRAGSNMLFGDGASHAGPVVPFVLWFNFLAGFAYVIAGVGLVLRKRWSEVVAVGLALSTVLVALAFGVHALTGGAYATRTVGALAIRIAFWAFVAHRAHVALGSPPKVAESAT